MLSTGVHRMLVGNRIDVSPTLSILNPLAHFYFLNKTRPCGRESPVVVNGHTNSFFNLATTPGGARKLRFKSIALMLAKRSTRLNSHTNDKFQVHGLV